MTDPDSTTQTPADKTSAATTSTYSTEAASPSPDRTALSSTTPTAAAAAAAGPSNVAIAELACSSSGRSEPVTVASSSSESNPVNDDPLPSSYPSSTPTLPDVSTLALSTTTEPTTTNASTTIQRDTSEAAIRLTETITTTLDTLLNFHYSTPPHPLGEPNKFFIFSCNGRAANYQYRFEARVSHLAIYCTSPVRIPEAQRLLIAEFTARVNFGVLLGGLEIDLRDGELRYTIVQRNVSGLWDDAQLIADLFVISLRMMDKFFPGIMAITYANKSPAQAVQACEEQYEALHRQQQQASSEQ